MKHLELKINCLMLCLAVFFSFSLLNCRGEKAQESSKGFDIEDSQEKSKVFLQIKDSFYLSSDFENYVRNIVDNELKDLTQASLSRLLDNFIEEKILLQAAKDKEISLTWDEKKEYLAKLRNESWAGVKKESIDEVENKNLFERLLVEKYTYELVKNIDVNEEEILEYYNMFKKEFLKPERVEVSQILLDTEDKAIEVLEKLKKATEERFSEIAREESIGVEALKGGRMGLFEMGELPFEMENVVFSLKEGELSQVVESSYGYHIFRLDKRYEPELVPFEEASPSIKLKILDQKIKQLISQNIEDLKKSMEWSFYPQNLSFPYQRNN